MEIQIAVAKTNKFAAIESGDTLEVIERPNGGMSIVLADGQSTEQSPKYIANFVVHKAISLITEGIRDGTVALATSDHLFTEHHGKAHAYLSILSVDFQTSTIIITRNTPTPVIVAHNDRIEILSSESTPIGMSPNVRPTICEYPLETGLTILIYTDGVMYARERDIPALDIRTFLESMLEEQEPDTQKIADILLSEAIRLDNGRPQDDMSVVVLRVLSTEPDQIRRMSVRLPAAKQNFYS